MAESTARPLKSTARVSSSALVGGANQDPFETGGVVRPRNRRLASADDGDGLGTETTAAAGSTRGPSPSSSGFLFDGGLLSSDRRAASPLPASHIGMGSGAAGRKTGPRGGTSGGGGGGGGGGGAFGKGLLDGSWTSSWASVQEFATSLLTGETSASDTRGLGSSSSSRNGSRSRPRPLNRDYSAGGAASSRREPMSWGPAPPDISAPGAKDIAAGSLAERETALRAARTASVLESYEGVNGGLDVAGRYKHRTSDDLSRGPSGPGSSGAAHGGGGDGNATDEHLVYIHRVQPTDTYVGVVLKYRCREEAFRKANGLWSRDGVQVRKWLAVPVDACEVKGRPCEPPSYYVRGVDLLAPTPEASEVRKPDPSPFGDQARDDFFSLPANGSSAEHTKPAATTEEENNPWAHVRWVSIDGFAQPVEIARVPRKALGYFPPRRKKSLHTVSTMSTPRQSLDVPSFSGGDRSPGRGDAETAGDQGALTGADNGTSSRRHSSLSSRPQLLSTPTATSTRSRVGSGSGGDMRPVWMRRPGGVGSMGKNVRTPGPERDYLNSWTKKHLPGLNIDSLPSMSVMGSETASFGFGSLSLSAAASSGVGGPGGVGGGVGAGADGTGIAESHFLEGRDVGAASRQGSGLDRAAAFVETWLRGALAGVKRPSTPILGPRRPGPDDGDLIELADTNSDDGRTVLGGDHGGGGGGGGGIGPSLLSSMSMASSRSMARGEGDGAAQTRGRMPGPGIKGKKDD